MDIISPGLSVGYAAKRVSLEAKQNEVRMIPVIRGRQFTIGVLNMISPAIRGRK